MPMKKTLNDNVAKTRAKVSQALNQAKESLKLLEILEKETLAKAKTLVKNPLGSDRRKAANDKIFAKLKDLGIATQDEVNMLKDRISELESQVASLKSAKSSKSSSKSAAATAHQAEALPQS